MRQWIRSTWNRLAPIRRFINKAVDSLGIIMIILGIIGLVIFVLIIGCITITQVTMIFSGTAHLKGLSDSILSMIGLDTSTFTNEEYIEVIYGILSILIVLVTIWFAIVTIMNNVKYRREAKRNALIKKQRVYNIGVDDLEIMLEHYKNDEDVMVFYGDFS